VTPLCTVYRTPLADLTPLTLTSRCREATVQISATDREPFSGRVYFEVSGLGTASTGPG
jgi:hypothetical protein